MRNNPGELGQMTQAADRKRCCSLVMSLLPARSPRQAKCLEWREAESECRNAKASRHTSRLLYRRSRTDPAGRTGAILHRRERQSRDRRRPDSSVRRTCRSCHKAEYQQYAKTRHAGLSIAKGAHMSCETCHGPGQAPRRRRAGSAGRRRENRCRDQADFFVPRESQAEFGALPAVPLDQPEQSNFQHSPHAAHGVACNDCHATHLVTRRLAAPARPPPQRRFSRCRNCPKRNDG